MLDAPDTVGGVRGPGRELLGKGTDVGPFAGAGGGGEARSCGSEGGEVEAGEEGGGEDNEAVAVEGVEGSLVGVG